MAGTLTASVEGLLRPGVEALGFDLVMAEYVSGRRPILRLYIDSEAGITVDDCAEVSHYASGVLDVDDLVPGAYTLEVSSPGLDRPLPRLKDFARYVGHEARLVLRQPSNGRRRLTGTLRGVQGDRILVEVEGERCQWTLGDIQSARLVADLDQEVARSG